MNIFYLDKDPHIAAEYMVDSHVVKMILESAQMLSTAHRILDGKQITFDKYVPGSFPARYRKTTFWQLDNKKDRVLYSATHVNHPCAVWVRQSEDNYLWLLLHFAGLCREYTFRYGKQHKSYTLGQYLVSPPENIPEGPFTDPPCAMEEQYIISDDAVINYRNYYKLGKAHLHNYTKRNPPLWLSEG